MTHKLLSMAIAGSILLSSTVFAANADAAKKYTERTMDNGYIRIQNEGGAQLSYDPNSGVQILEDDGYAFKDLNKNGKLAALSPPSIQPTMNGFTARKTTFRLRGIMLFTAPCGMK